MIIKKLPWQAVLAIRHKVLWPQKPPSFCKVIGDEDAIHYGVYIQNQLVCVASIYIDDDIKSARLRKFATLEAFQGKGIGSKLINHIIIELKTLGIDNFWCDARTTAISFYQKFNMEKHGDEFNKSDVLYVKMQVTLDNIEL